MYVFNVTHLFLEDILCLFPGGGNMKVKCMKHCPLYVGSYTLYRKFQGQSIATLEILKFDIPLMFSTQNSVSFYSRLWEFIAKVV